MLERWKRRWHDFRAARPGHRFQERYERNRAAGSQQSPLVRALQPVAGVLLLIAGIIFCLIPGPGLPLLALGAALLASASHRIAIAMDHLELRGRSLLSRLRRRWKES